MSYWKLREISSGHSAHQMQAFPDMSFEDPVGLITSVVSVSQNLHPPFYSWYWYSVVSVRTRPRAMHLKIMVWFLAGAWDFFHFSMSTLTPEPIHPPIQWVLEYLSFWIQCWGMSLTTVLHIKPWFSMSGAIPLCPLMSSWHVQGQVYLCFTSTLSLVLIVESWKMLWLGHHVCVCAKFPKVIQFSSKFEKQS
jgi:hypothetical protein